MRQVCLAVLGLCVLLATVCACFELAPSEALSMPRVLRVPQWMVDEDDVSVWSDVVQHVKERIGKPDEWTWTQRIPSLDEVRRWRHSLQGGRSPLEEKQVPSVFSEDSGLPAEFDAATAWPECYPRVVLDQGNCGSCWAFGSTEALSDRFCIHSNGTVNVTLSPQDLLSCEHINLHCTMGSLPNFAWDFLASRGVTTLDCVPYVSGDGHVPSCPKQCEDGGNYKLYHAQNVTHVGSLLDPKKHLDEIRQALLDGPVSVDFNVYSDFYSYAGGVYVHQHGGYEGLHSVKVFGYGTENGVAYWLAQNSWGTNFGMNGYFKIGVDQCGVSDLVYTGYPVYE